MPVDKCEYVALVPLHTGFLLKPKAFARARGLELHKVRRRPYRRKITITFEIMGCQGLKFRVSKIPGQPLARMTVTANPGRILRRHNGQVLLESEFHDFGAIVINNLTPLVSEPSAIPDLFPGLRPGGPTHWTYLELLLHIRDADGTVFQKLRHGSHPRIRVPSRYWDGESIELGRKKGDLQFSVYYKAKEMRANSKPCGSVSPDYDDILRLEVRLRGSALTDYLGIGRNVEERVTTNVELSADTWTETVSVEKRLVRFTAADVFCAHRRLFGELRGVWSSDHVPRECKALERMGRFLGEQACLPGLSLPELLSIMKTYLGKDYDGTGRIRKAAVEELDQRSGLRLCDQLSTSSYQLQPGIPVPSVERLVKHDPYHTGAPCELTRAYTPADRPFRPHVSIPAYFDFHSETTEP